MDSNHNAVDGSQCKASLMFRTGKVALKIFGETERWKMEGLDVLAVNYAD